MKTKQNIEKICKNCFMFDIDVKAGCIIRKCAINDEEVSETFTCEFCEVALKPIRFANIETPLD